MRFFMVFTNSDISFIFAQAISDGEVDKTVSSQVESGKYFRISFVSNKYILFFVLLMISNFIVLFPDRKRSAEHVP